MRSSQRVCSAVSTVGMACFDLISSLPIVDSLQMGSHMSLRSFAHIESALFILDYVVPDTSTSTRSLACPNLATSALDLGHFELFLSLQAFSRIGPTASPFGKAPLDFMLLIIGLAKADPSMSSRSSAHLDSALLALDRAAVGPSAPVRQPAHFGLSAPLLGLSRLGSVSSLPVVSSVSLGSPMFVHSFACSGLPALVLDYAHVEPMPLLRAMTRPGSSASTFGICSFQYAAAMPVLNALVLGSQTSVRSRARLDSAISVVDFAHTGPATLARSSARTGLSAFAMSLSRAGLSLFVLLSTHLELSIFIRSFNQLEPFLLAMVPGHTGLPTSTRSPACTGFAALVTGLCNIGSIFSPSVIDRSTLDSSLFTRSFARCDFRTSVLDHLRLGFVSLARGSVHVALSAFVSGLACQGFVSFLPVTDSATLGPLLLSRSFS